MCCLKGLLVRGARGRHGKSLLHFFFQFWVGYPFANNARFPISLFTNLGLFGFVASGWEPSWGLACPSQVLQTTLHILAQIHQKALLCPVDQGFHHRGKHAIWNVIGHGVQHISTAPEVRPDNLCIQLSACWT